MAHSYVFLALLMLFSFSRSGLCFDQRQRSSIATPSISCTTDTYLRLLESDLPDADPFCRSFIGLDYIVTSPNTLPCAVYSATARHKIQVALPAITAPPHHDLERKLIEAQPSRNRHHRHMSVIARGNDPQLALDISSACTCLGLTPNTTTITLAPSCSATTSVSSIPGSRRTRRPTRLIKSSSTKSTLSTTSPSSSRSPSPTKSTTFTKSVDNTISGSVSTTRSSRRRRSTTSTRATNKPTTASTSSKRSTSSTRSKSRTRPTSKSSSRPTSATKSPISAESSRSTTSGFASSTSSSSQTRSTTSSRTSVSSDGRDDSSTTLAVTSTLTSASSTGTSSNSVSSNEKTRSSRTRRRTSSTQTASTIRSSTRSSDSSSKISTSTEPVQTREVVSTSDTPTTPSRSSTSEESLSSPSSRPTSTVVTATTSSTTPICAQTQVVSNPSFESYDGIESNDWMINEVSGGLMAINAPNGHSGERHLRIRSNSTGGLIVITQRVDLCPNTRYTFSAWTRRIFPQNRCQATFMFGNFPVALTNLLDDKSSYQQITGVFGPISTSRVLLHIGVTCSGEAGSDGSYRLALDDITLTKAS